MEKRLAELQFEIAGYRYLVSSLAVAIERASATLEVASMGKTRGGMLRAAFGIALSVFGAAKTVNLLLSVTVRRLSGEDAATVALRAVVTAFRMQDLVDVQTMASRVALLLNACLVSSAVRGFLILMFRLSQSKHGPPPGANNNSGNGGSGSSPSSLSPLPGETTELGGDEGSGGGAHDGENDDTEETARRALLFYDDDEQDGNAAAAASSSLTLGDDGGNEVVGRNAAASGALRNRWWYALLFGGPAVDRCAGTLSLVSFSLFMGLHFLGAFVLLRLGFPARSRGVIIEAVGAVPFVPCHSVHDVSFLVAVAATAVVLRVLRRMDDADTATAAGDAADDDDLML